MWRLLILVPILLLVLANPARTEEVAAPKGIDPAEVAKLLLSGDEAERERGVALLQERVRRGGDVRTWLVAMARAQTEWADAEERLVERWIQDVIHGSLERAKKARRLIAAVGRDATRRLLENLKDGKVPPAPSAVAAVPQRDVTQEAPPQPPRAPAAPRAPRPPIGLVRAEVIEVPQREILTSLATDRDAYGKGADGLARLEHDRAVLVQTKSAYARAAGLPEARSRSTLPPQVLVTGRALPLVEADTVRYRSRVRRTKGAWAVDTDLLQRGLQVTVLGTAKNLEIEARYVSVPDPLPIELTRPAPNVEPLELDRPEWETAAITLRTTTEAARAGIVAFFPGLVPDKVVVVRLRLLPLGQQAAVQAREQTR